VLLFCAGVAAGLYALIIFRTILYANLMANDWLLILLGTLVVAVVGVVVIKLQTRAGKIATV